MTWETGLSQAQMLRTEYFRLRTTEMPTPAILRQNRLLLVLNNISIVRMLVTVKLDRDLPGMPAFIFSASS